VSYLKSHVVVLMLALAAGLILTLSMGAALKVEAEHGAIVAHLPMFIFGTGAAWLVLSVCRYLVVQRGADHG